MINATLYHVVLASFY